MENEKNIALIIGIGALALVFFGLLVIAVTSIFKRKILQKQGELHRLENEKQIELFRAVAKAEENQKFKIAGDLHDEIIPVLAFRSRNLASAISKLEKSGVNIEDLRQDVDALSEISERIRDIAHDIIPRLFTAFGFVKSIGAFIKQMNLDNGPTAEFHNKSAFTNELPLSKDDQLILFRIGLEILNNIAKHAHYEYLVVSLENSDNTLILKFAHDGSLITNEEIAALRESSSGIGLKSMRSRALFLNATIDYYGDPGVSYIRVTVPIAK